ncbi:MAG: hypothetical protein Q8K78_15960 [Planctomycetaceae bacterium]|nr:hypothetical protein [Planctomycetaceae bacterium]
MSALAWNTPSPLTRGIVIEAKKTASAGELSDALTECWQHAIAFCEQLKLSDESVTVEVEIWPDTGRIIWVFTDRREFGRLELSVPEIEASYFTFLKSNMFEESYAQLVQHTMALVTRTLGQFKSTGLSRVVVRDSDSIETANVIFEE